MPPMFMEAWLCELSMMIHSCGFVSRSRYTWWWWGGCGLRVAVGVRGAVRLVSQYAKHAVLAAGIVVSSACQRAVLVWAGAASSFV
jgi:hypothetical protein